MSSITTTSGWSACRSISDGSPRRLLWQRRCFGQTQQADDAIADQISLPVTTNVDAGKATNAFDNHLRIVRLGDSCKRLYHLHHRPIGDPLAVGKAAPNRDAGTTLNSLYELSRDPRLSCAGGRDDRHQLAILLINRSF